MKRKPTLNIFDKLQDHSHVCLIGPLLSVLVFLILLVPITITYHFLGGLCATLLGLAIIVGLLLVVGPAAR